jgi:hypothetical protein
MWNQSHLVPTHFSDVCFKENIVVGGCNLTIPCRAALYGICRHIQAKFTASADVGYTMHFQVT